MKQYNTPEYRKERRIVSWVEPAIKRKVESAAKKAEVSVSSFVGEILNRYFEGE